MLHFHLQNDAKRGSVLIARTTYSNISIELLSFLSLGKKNEGGNITKTPTPIAIGTISNPIRYRSVRMRWPFHPSDNSTLRYPLRISTMIVDTHKATNTGHLTWGASAFLCRNRRLAPTISMAKTIVLLNWKMIPERITSPPWLSCS